MNTETQHSAESILIAAGKPLRNTCRILIFLEQHPEEHYTNSELARALDLTIDQVRTATYQLAKKSKIARISGRAGPGATFRDNPGYQGSKRPRMVRSKTAASRLHSRGDIPAGLLSFAKYVEQKIMALDHVIPKANDIDKDMLIRMRNEYESLRIRSGAA